MTHYSTHHSSEAVKSATGKTPEEWYILLDDEDAKKMSYKDIVNFLAGNNLVNDKAMRQHIATGYELTRGKRVSRNKADAGLEVTVQKALPISVSEAWALVTSAEGIRIWLGNTPRLNFRPRVKFRTPDGTRGEIKLVQEEAKIRLIWVPRGWKHATTLQVSLIPNRETTTVRFRQEKLPGQREYERMRSHWQDVLEQMEALVVEKS